MPGSSGPLAGLRVVELGAIGPVPHAAMVLADLGADVVRVERPAGRGLDLAGAHVDPLLRGRRSVALDLKDPADLGRVLDLVACADVLLEGMRPGVAERLGIGPDDCLGRQPRLVYGRMTGWGRDGPLAASAGHDLNYVALTGVLSAIGAPDAPPTVPLNLVGDYGGGSMLLLVGVLAALWERERSGTGQVVDAAMVDGVAVLAQILTSMRSFGLWREGRGTNLLDGGAPFYATYVCADGGHVAVGALEPQFYSALLDGLGVAGEDGFPDRDDPAQWPALRARLAALFASAPRDAWAERFAGTDACVTPVLGLAEAQEHPHAVARGGYVEVDGIRQAAPAPRFSRTAPATPSAPPAPGSAPAEDVLDGWRSS